MSQAESSYPQQIILPSTHTQKMSQNTVQKLQNPLSNKKQIAQKLNQHIIHHIQDQIMESKISVSSSNRNLHVRHSLMDQSPPQKIHQIVKKKKELQDEIARLNYQQSRAKVQLQKIHAPKARSEFTKQQHEQILKALQAKKQLDQELAFKNQLIQQQIEQKIKQQQAQRKAKMQQICKQKQVKIVQHLRQLQAKRYQRERQIKQLNKNYQNVKGRTFLHQKMEKKWKLQQKKHQQEDKSILTERKKGKQFSINSIIEHQKKYRTFIANNSKQKQQKIKQTKIQKQLMEKQVLSHYRPSHFLQTIFQQQKQIKIQQQKRNEMIKILTQTKTKYGQSIRQMNKQAFEKKKSLPPIKQNKQQSNQQQLSKNKSKISELPRSSKSMSRLQIAEIGNKYLREVHSSIDHIQRKQKGFKTTSKHNQPPKIEKYQDYLQDLKRKRAQQPINPQLKQISQLKKVLKRNQNPEDKLYHAKLIAYRLQGKAKSNTNMLINSINAKLAILDQFSS